MKEYKCISCGHVKKSKSTCVCPICGYMMFETPYVRADVLKKEIQNFVFHFRPSKVQEDKFEIYRHASKGIDAKDGKEKHSRISKKQDEERFPDYEKIQSYICSSEKTEEFYNRSTHSLEQIRMHINTSYVQDYQVAFGRIEAEISKWDHTLQKVLTEIDVNADLPKVYLPNAQLHYTEIPNEKLVNIANGLLDDLCALVDKINRFIRQNNIYGNLYQKKYSDVVEVEEDMDYLIALRTCREHLSEMLTKWYIIDICSDGAEELGEMLTEFWHGVETIMSAPMLNKEYVYVLEDGITLKNVQFNNVIFEQINKRYEKLDVELLSQDFLCEHSEEEIFAIYDKMIELDSYKFMGVDKSELLKIGESEQKLNELIGLTGIKESIKKIKAYALANADSNHLNIHMCFLGNPGTGKTEVARYIAGILYENKILPSKKVIEVDRSGLVSQFFGATAEKTTEVIEKAMGGVLFVDEAYALGNGSDSGITDYGKEAIDTLVKAMEDYRGKFCVIFAGYKNEMLQMLSINPGLKSRIQFMLDFPNYSRDELKSMTELMLKKRQYLIADVAMSRVLDITDVKRKEINFANAREIRNILDQLIMCQNVRCLGTEDRCIELIDVNQYIKDAQINLPTNAGLKGKILTGEEELDRLIGLASIKRMIKKIKAYAKKNQGEEGFNLHMCFYGNPGTGKTEVARILSRILYEAGVLKEAKIIETDGQGLIGRYVGETAPKTESKINDAMNGVLFIDEAYSLSESFSTDGASSSYGHEAIAVLLKKMEDHRGKFCVILAGYKEEMNHMLSTNPGFESRIQFKLDFLDYEREELSEIATTFLNKKNYQIDYEALEKILDITEYFRQKPNFANARTVRNILDQVILNQNLRAEDELNNKRIILSDVDEYILDENIDLKRVLHK